jgi:hypothetical protein
MTRRTRTLIGKYASLAGREAIYETADGFDVETREGYDVIERRVLFSDVVLVTLHRHYGIPYLLTTGLLSLFVAVLAVIIYFSIPGAGASGPAIVVALFGIPSFVAFLLRATFGVDRITIFGRRSKAQLGFRVRKRRAREAYERICALVRNAQQGIASAPGNSPPQDRPDHAPWVSPF